MYTGMLCLRSASISCWGRYGLLGGWYIVAIISGPCSVCMLIANVSSV